MKTAQNWNNILYALNRNPDAGLGDTQDLLRDVQIDALKYVFDMVTTMGMNMVQDDPETGKPDVVAFTKGQGLLMAGTVIQATIEEIAKPKSEKQKVDEFRKEFTGEGNPPF